MELVRCSHELGHTKRALLVYCNNSKRENMTCRDRDISDLLLWALPFDWWGFADFSCFSLALLGAPWRLTVPPDRKLFQPFGRFFTLLFFTFPSYFFLIHIQSLKNIPIALLFPHIYELHLSYEFDPRQLDVSAVISSMREPKPQ